MKNPVFYNLSYADAVRLWEYVKNKIMQYPNVANAMYIDLESKSFLFKPFRELACAAISEFGFESINDFRVYDKSKLVKIESLRKYVEKQVIEYAVTCKLGGKFGGGEYNIIIDIPVDMCGEDYLDDMLITHAKNGIIDEIMEGATFGIPDLFV